MSIFISIYKNKKEKILFILLFIYILSKKYKKIDKYSNYKSDRWIVLLTYNSPTATIDYLARYLKNWKIIVLGDKKSKDDKWNIYNSSNVIYLSFKEQQHLGYKSLKFIKSNSNARKNIGYLFAIEHGAKLIYEIDDDIIVNDLKSINVIYNKEYKYSRLSIGFNKNSKMINPYSYFGIKDIWPRGFLLNDIGYDNNEFFNYALTQIKLKPLIYEYLINGEPDMDELFHQTRKKKNSSFNIFFNQNDPLLYIPGNYIPINSKNTKYLYDIFPSLPIFISLNEKINDIFRGYIMQLYAWKYNGGVIFLPPNAYKRGNWNDKNTNLIKEKKLYFEIKRFLKVLKYVEKEGNPKEFLINIIKSLVKNEILKKIDLDIYNAFLEDLSTFNYIYSHDFNIKNIIDNYKNYIIISSKFSYSQISQGKIFLLNSKENKLIKHITSNKVYKNILLIIIYNYSKLIFLNSYMIQLYKKFFPNIVFLKEGFQNLNRKDLIECKESSKGFYSYKCFREVYNRYPNMKGYLFIDDDNFIKPWQLENLNFNIPWINKINIYCNITNPALYIKRNSSLWKRLNHTYFTLKYLLNRNISWKNNVRNFYGIKIVNVLVDIVYIPNNIMKQFCDIVEIMYESKIFIQIAIPIAFGIMQLEKMNILTSIFLWKKKRKLVINYLRTNFSYISVHPIKFSNKYNRKHVIDYISFINALKY